eukprot:322226_1
MGTAFATDCCCGNESNTKPTQNTEFKEEKVDDPTKVTITTLLQQTKDNVIHLCPEKQKHEISLIFADVIKEVQLADPKQLRYIIGPLQKAKDASAKAKIGKGFAVLAQFCNIVGIIAEMAGEPELKPIFGVISGIFSIFGTIFGFGLHDLYTDLSKELQQLLTQIKKMIDEEYIKQLENQAAGAFAVLETILTNINTISFEAAKIKRDKWSKDMITTAFGYWDDSTNGSQGTAITEWIWQATNALSMMKQNYQNNNIAWKANATNVNIQGFGTLTEWFCKIGLLHICNQLSWQGMLYSFTGDKYAESWRLKYNDGKVKYNSFKNKAKFQFQGDAVQLSQFGLDWETMLVLGSEGYCDMDTIKHFVDFIGLTPNIQTLPDLRNYPNGYYCSLSRNGKQYNMKSYVPPRGSGGAGGVDSDAYIYFGDGDDNIYNVTLKWINYIEITWKSNWTGLVALKPLSTEIWTDDSRNGVVGLMMMDWNNAQIPVWTVIPTNTPNQIAIAVKGQYGKQWITATQEKQVGYISMEISATPTAINVTMNS